MAAKPCGAQVFDPDTKRATKRCPESAVFEVTRSFSGITQLLCEQHHDGKRAPGVTVKRIGGWERMGYGKGRK